MNRLLMLLLMSVKLFSLQDCRVTSRLLSNPNPQWPPSGELGSVANWHGIESDADGTTKGGYTEKFPDGDCMVDTKVTILPDKQVLEESSLLRPDESLVDKVKKQYPSIEDALKKSRSATMHNTLLALVDKEPHVKYEDRKSQWPPREVLGLYRSSYPVKMPDGSIFYEIWSKFLEYASMVQASGFIFSDGSVNTKTVLWDLNKENIIATRENFYRSKLEAVSMGQLALDQFAFFGSEYDSVSLQSQYERSFGRQWPPREISGRYATFTLPVNNPDGSTTLQSKESFLLHGIVQTTMTISKDGKVKVQRALFNHYKKMVASGENYYPSKISAVMEGSAVDRNLLFRIDMGLPDKYKDYCLQDASMGNRRELVSTIRKRSNPDSSKSYELDVFLSESREILRTKVTAFPDERVEVEESKVDIDGIKTETSKKMFQPHELVTEPEAEWLLFKMREDRRSGTLDLPIDECVWYPKWPAGSEVGGLSSFSEKVNHSDGSIAQASKERFADSILQTAITVSCDGKVTVTSTHENLCREIVEKRTITYCSVREALEKASAVDRNLLFKMDPQLSVEYEKINPSWPSNKEEAVKEHFEEKNQKFDGSITQEGEAVYLNSSVRTKVAVFPSGEVRVRRQLYNRNGAQVGAYVQNYLFGEDAVILEAGHARNLLLNINPSLRAICPAWPEKDEKGQITRFEVSSVNQAIDEKFSNNSVVATKIYFLSNGIIDMISVLRNSDGEVVDRRQKYYDSMEKVLEDLPAATRKLILKKDGALRAEDVRSMNFSGGDVVRQYAKRGLGGVDKKALRQLVPMVRRALGK